MLSRCKLIGLLTPRQLEILTALSELKNKTSIDTLWRPKELGAYRSSHHAKTLQGLEQQGLVARELLTEGMRPSYGYRITPQGCEILSMFKDLVNVPLEAILGTSADRMRARFAYRMAA